MQNLDPELFNYGAPVTLSIMLLVLLFSTTGFYSQAFYLKAILHPVSIFRRKEYYRLLSSDLVHNDLSHLLINEFMLYLGCASLEEMLKKNSPFGSLQFLFIYLSGWLSGTLYSAVRHRNDFNFSSAGCSGSILGCLFGFILLEPDHIAFYLPGIGAVKNVFGGLIYIALLLWHQKKRKNQGTANHELHFFGALGGTLATLVLFPHAL